MRLPRQIALISAAALAAACATTEPIVLRHPDGRTVQCGPYDNRPAHAMASAYRERGCIEDFQRQGFERVPKQ
jgi:hypothetical protein